MATSVVGADDYAIRQRERGRLVKIFHRALRGSSRQGAGGFVAVGAIVITVAAMMLTLFGAGAISQALSLSDGAIWLWDGNRAEAARVNTAAGQIDMRRALSDSRGHQVKVIQTDEHLLLQDLQNGTVTSVDLRTLSTSGVVSPSRPADMRVALFGSDVVFTDVANGSIRQFDAGKMAPRGRAYKLSSDLIGQGSDLVGGEFDDDGRLWVGSPKAGKVMAIRLGSDGKGPSLEREISVDGARHAWSMGVLDHGAAVIDRTANTFTKAKGDGSVSSMQLPAVGKAVIPSRVRGDTIAITNPQDRKVVLVKEADARAISIPGLGDKIGPAVAFSDQLYVPDEQANRVRVFDLQGNGLQSINDPGGKVEMVNREGILAINSVGTDKAWLVHPDHTVKELEKAPKDIIAGEGPNRSGDLKGNAGKTTPGPGQTTPGPGQDGGAQQGSSDGHGNGSDSGSGPQISKPRDTGASAPNPDKSSKNPSSPAAPTSVGAQAGDASATVSWQGADSRGSTITKYLVTGGPRKVEVAADACEAGKACSVNVTGLTNGKSYEFSVRAVNAKGEGEAAKANPVTPSSVKPDPPAPPHAAANPNGSVSVSWQPPNTHGGTVGSYQLTGQTPTAGGQVVINRIDPPPPNSASPNDPIGYTVGADSLTMGAHYTFIVVATLTNGVSSDASGPSNEVIAFGPPGAPSITSAVGAGPGAVSVEWTPPAVTNGSTITGYTVTAEGTGVQQSAGANASSATLTGLPEGRTVAVTVTASNTAGSTSSQPVSVLVPGAQPAPQPQPQPQPTQPPQPQPSPAPLPPPPGPPPTQPPGPPGPPPTQPPPGPQPSPTPPPPPPPGPPPAPAAGHGVARCVSPDSDPAHKSYCNGGIRTFSAPNQQSAPRGAIALGPDGTAPITATCQANGQNITPWIYNDRKAGPQWFRLDNGAFIPYAWTQGIELGKLPPC